MKKSIFSFSAKEKLLMKKLGVAALVLFGSQASGTATPKSDFDVGILLKDRTILTSPKRKTKVYDALYDILSAQIKKLVDIDIVFLEEAPSELQAHAVNYGRVIFESERNAFANFKEYIIIKVADFTPLKAIFHRGILGRIH